MATVDRYAIQIDTAQATQSIDTLRTAIGGLLAAFSVSTFIDFADSVTNLKNRLTQLTPSIEAANEQFKGIAAIAVAARSDLAATGDLYFRIARSADQLGISQREAADITESLAKAMSASGLGAKEAAGPLLQLGQALQSGVLQGDELRSILEGLPVVAKALANSLGVPVGALKQLGSEGKISATDVVRALQQARDAIERDFARTVPTIGQAFNVLKTAIALAFNEFENNTQTAQTLAGSIELIAFYIFKLAKNIDAIIGPLKILAQILLTLAAASIVGKVLGAIGGIALTATRTIGMLGYAVKETVSRFKDFFTIARAAGGGVLAFTETVAFALMPVGRLIKGVLTLGAAIGTFIGLDKLFEYIGGVGKEGSSAQNDLEEFRKEMARLRGGFDETKTEGTATQVVMAKLAKEVRNVTFEYQKLIGENQRRYRQQTANIGLSDQERTRVEALQDAETQYFQAIEPLLKRYRELQQTGKKEDAAASIILSQKIKELGEAYVASLPALKEDTYQRILANRELRIQGVEYNNLVNSLGKVRAIREEIANLGLSEAERATRTAEAQNRAAEEEAVRQENIARLGQANYLKGMRLPESDPGIVRIRQSFADALKQEKAALDDLYPAKVRDQQINFEISQSIRARQEAARSQLELEKMGLSELEKKYKDIDFAAQERAENEIDRLDRILLSTRELSEGISIRNLPQYNDLVTQIRQNAALGAEQQIASVKALDEMSRSFSYGWTNAFREYLRNATNAAQIAANIFNKAVKGMEDTLVNFVKTGKFEWRNFVSMMLEELLRAQIQQMFANMMGSMNNSMRNVGAAGGGGGGLLDYAAGALSNLFAGGFANGGKIPAGQFGIVGERGPEFISGPANITPMGNEPAIQNVTYNINAVDAMSFKALVASDPAFIHAVATQGSRSIPGRR